MAKTGKEERLQIRYFGRLKVWELLSGGFSFSSHVKYKVGPTTANMGGG